MPGKHSDFYYIFTTIDVLDLPLFVRFMIIKNNIGISERERKLRKNTAMHNLTKGVFI